MLCQYIYFREAAIFLHRSRECLSGKHSKELDCGVEALSAKGRELRSGESHGPFYAFDSGMCVHVYICAHVSVSVCVSLPGVSMCACSAWCVSICVCGPHLCVCAFG